MASQPLPAILYFLVNFPYDGKPARASRRLTLHEFSSIRGITYLNFKLKEQLGRFLVRATVKEEKGGGVAKEAA